MSSASSSRRSSTAGRWSSRTTGSSWATCGCSTREDDAVEVRFGGNGPRMDGPRQVQGGAGGLSVRDGRAARLVHLGLSLRRRQQARRCGAPVVPQGFDMAAFSRGDYARALEQNTMAETISKVLYPADDHIEGKRLRLKQQYLLVSASLQIDSRRSICKQYGTLSNLADKVAVHINDTHPALCVPELMRLLVDEYELRAGTRRGRSPARALSYTNHTVMAEALERWHDRPVPRAAAARLRASVQRDRPPPHRATGCSSPIPSDWGEDRLYGASSPSGEVRMANLLPCCVPQGQRRVTAAHADFERRYFQRLCPTR